MGSLALEEVELPLLSKRLKSSKVPFLQETCTNVKKILRNIYIVVKSGPCGDNMDKEKMKGKKWYEKLKAPPQHISRRRIAEPQPLAEKYNVAKDISWFETEDKGDIKDIISKLEESERKLREHLVVREGFINALEGIRLAEGKLGIPHIKREGEEKEDEIRQEIKEIKENLAEIAKLKKELREKGF